MLYDENNQKEADSDWQKVRQHIGHHALQLGPVISHQALCTPRHLAFVFSRYKFATKLLASKPNSRVLELGCGEGIGTLLLAEDGHIVTGVDNDKDAIAYASQHLINNTAFNISFTAADFFTYQNHTQFDAVISLDVIEHIPQENENAFMELIDNHLDQDGFCCIGTPNINAHQYASEHSRIGHINLYGAERLRNLLGKYFKNVFIFGMNDEVVHTGFYPMCHYLMALACNKKM